MMHTGDDGDCPVCAAAKARRAERTVIRDNDYYGGSVWVSGRPEYEFDLCEVKITWEAYQGGSAEIVLQDVEELEALARWLQDAAKTLRGDES